MPTQKNRLGLSIGQTVLLTAIGSALWLLAVIILYIVAPRGALEGPARAITYALIIVGTLPFVFLTRYIVRLRIDQVAVGIAVVTATALVIDGIVVAWFPSVYGGNLPQVTASAAAILWGAGVALVLGFIVNKGESE